MNKMVGKILVENPALEEELKYTTLFCVVSRENIFGTSEYCHRHKFYIETSELIKLLKIHKEENPTYEMQKLEGGK